MYIELDAWGKYEQDSLKKQKKKKTNPENFTGNCRKSKNFGKRFRAAFYQHKTSHKALTLSIQLIKLQTHLILNYSDNSKKRELGEERDKDKKKDIEKNTFSYHC